MDEIEIEYRESASAGYPVNAEKRAVKLVFVRRGDVYDEYLALIRENRERGDVKRRQRQPARENNTGDGDGDKQYA